MEEQSPEPRTPWLLVGLVAASAAASGLALLAAGGAREAAEQSRTESRAASKAADRSREASEKAAKGLEDLRNDLELLATNVDAVQRNVKELADKINFGGAGTGGLGDPGLGSAGTDGPRPQKFVQFSPELRESLRKAVAAKGVDLLEDRVLVPGVVTLRQGALEFFAVFPGGRGYESIFLLTGRPAEKDGRVEGLGAALNSCLMALGLQPGVPARPLSGGRTLPAQGTPVHIAVEWEEEGKTVRVRAEDLVWDRVNNRSLEPGQFLYVGSFFNEGDYVPDLTGSAVAVNSAESCVVDRANPRALDYDNCVPCTPRIPPEGTKVRVVFSPKPLEPTRTWDPTDPKKRTDPGQGGADGK